MAYLTTAHKRIQTQTSLNSPRKVPTAGCGNYYVACCAELGQENFDEGSVGNVVERVVRIRIVLLLENTADGLFVLPQDAVDDWGSFSSSGRECRNLSNASAHGSPGMFLIRSTNLP